MIIDSTLRLSVWVLAVHCWSAHQNFPIELSMGGMGMVFVVSVVDVVVIVVGPAVKYQTAVQCHKIKFNCNILSFPSTVFPVLHRLVRVGSQCLQYFPCKKPLSVCCMRWRSRAVC